jgi:DNA-binding response OmpR family regulator
MSFVVRFMARSCESAPERQLTGARSFSLRSAATVEGEPDAEAGGRAAMKLLVVEDDAKIASAVKRGLEAEGFTVDVAADGNDGWWMATEGSYDLIVLDIMLPGRNGYVLCGDLRAAGNWTPILMLTAKSGDLDEAEALDTGADDFLSKPFSFPVLVARVRSLLRRAGGRDPAPLVAGPLRIDSGARRVWVDGHEVALTRREFDVLEFLARRADVAVSKDEILAGVWEFDFDGDPNIVEVYVARLRRKLAPHVDGEPITTVRGIGYRISRDGA